MEHSSAHWCSKGASYKVTLIMEPLSLVIIYWKSFMFSLKSRASLTQESSPTRHWTLYDASGSRRHLKALILTFSV
jgi:hypothetical protein